MSIDKSVKKFALITGKFKWALTADSNDPYGIEVTVVILDHPSTITIELSKRLQSWKILVCCELC